MRSCACDWAFIIQKSAECKNSSVFSIWAILSQKSSPDSFYSSLTASAVRMQQAMSIADNAEAHWWHDASRVSILTSCTMFMHNNTELGTSMFCLFLTKLHATERCERRLVFPSVPTPPPSRDLGEFYCPCSDLKRQWFLFVKQSASAAFTNILYTEARSTHNIN